MSRKELLFFRDMLIADRAEIIDRIRFLKSAVMSLSEHEIEVEESVQKAVITNSYDRLGEDGKLKIELIDLALRKMAVGEYGICESCGDDISPRRLEALPWSRMCIECAREHEKRREILPSPKDVVTSAKLPNEYLGVSSEKLVRMIYQNIEKHVEADSLAVKIFILNGVVYLEGMAATEVDRQMILQVLTEDMNFHAVVDLMEVEDESPGERDEYLPGSIPFSEAAEDLHV